MPAPTIDFLDPVGPRNGIDEAQLLAKRPGELDPSALTVTLNRSLTKPPPSAGLVFGTVFAPHMLVVAWSKISGWSSPEIKPYGPLEISPAAAVMQYGSAMFEGMKAYKAKDGSVRLFRPDMNMARLNRSAARLGLPSVDGEALLTLMSKLIQLNASFIPSEAGHSLYLRPTLVGTAETLGQGPPRSALLYVLCCPVGPYYPAGFKPVSLLATTQYVRAWPGGTGSYKLGMNYGASVVPAGDAIEKGYEQNLWLFGPEEELTEVGTMNLFVVFETESGETELVTAALDDGTILPGVTRDSALELARLHATGQLVIDGLPAKLKVSERKVTMSELLAKLEDGRVSEIFGTGTAAIVCTVERIGYRGGDIKIPVGADGFGDFSRAMLRELTARQYGAIEHPGWSYTCF